MTSLRTRFFLIVWPLVFGTAAAVGLGLSRWTRFELQREAWMTQGEVVDASAVAMDSLLAAMERSQDWSDVIALSEPVDPSGAQPAWIVADTNGVVVATTLHELESAELAFDPSGALKLERRSEGDDFESRLRVQLSGARIELPRSWGDDAGVPHWLFLVPGMDVERGGDGSGSPDRVGRFIAASDRTIVWMVLLASLAAAVATVVLSRPVVGAATELSRAARRLRNGDLDTRVPDLGRDELGEVGAAFNDLADRLKRSEATKRRMIEDAAHELRTPLTNVVGLAEAMAGGLRAADAEGFAALRSEAALLEQLVDDLQQVALGDGGRLDLYGTDFDMTERARTIAAVIGSRDQVAGSAIRVVGDCCPMRADPIRVDQILRNLMENAVRHSDGKEVDVIVEALDGRVRVTVRDYGLGIAPEHRDAVFERFYRVEASRSRGSGGMGLGLPIARQLAEAHGGSLTLLDQDTPGSTFVLELPATSQ